MDSRKVLKYWYDMEFFSPSVPMVNKETIYVKNDDDKIRWKKSKEYELSYEVYLGKIYVDDLVKQIIKSAKLNKETNEIEQDNTVCCLGAFKVFDNKKIVPGSFSISPFVYAVCKIINSKSIDIDFSEEEIRKINSKINDYINCNEEVTKGYIYILYNKIMKLIGFNSEFLDCCETINTKAVRKRGSVVSDKNDDNKDERNSILDSFYASDLNWILSELNSSDSVNAYIEGYVANNKNRVEVESSLETLKNILSPEKYPMGKWPSVYSPALMQQVAINISVDRINKKFSVNGPPGTGKTTLLKEIIASNVVDRAFEMCKFENPSDAFKKSTFKTPCSRFSEYYELNSKVSKYGIIVASNNNKAVENITTQLPKKDSVKNCRTNLFNLKSGDELYYSDLAKNLLDCKEDCWGLISARLGNKNNINKFNKTLWYDEGSLRDRKENISWIDAKNDFLNKYKEVADFKRYIGRIVKNTEKYDKMKTYINNLNKIEKCMEAIEKEREKLLKEQNDLENGLDFQDERLQDIKKGMNVFEKIINSFKKNGKIISVIENKLKIRDSLESNKIKLDCMDEEFSKLEKEKSIQEEKIEECEKLAEKIQEYKNEFKENFADEEFWNNVLENPDFQERCPWTNERFDKLREELFYYAIKLHKAFIDNSKEVKHNLGVFANISNCGLEDRKNAYSHILNTLFLIIPVISTTFASISNFLNGIQKNEIGTLIIDEAGQASPSSCMGAIWRCKKKIIVGDPLQVEPVVTIPKELSKIFADKYNIPNEYKNYELSIQNLADSINEYGGFRNNLWVRLSINCT